MAEYSQALDLWFHLLTNGKDSFGASLPGVMDVGNVGPRAHISHIHKKDRRAVVDSEE